MNRLLSVTATLVAMMLLCAYPAKAQKAPKREFRGAWIQCVNEQFQGLSKEEMQRTLSYQLEELAKDGVNAIIFQVRAECDALYDSPYEPWSRFLTGRQGQNPGWDPLAWMVSECHKRGMEIHAWINPYRAKTKGTSALASNNIAVKHPERVFEYDGLYILNPALPENREYICKIADDIVRRYDIDGFHIDDYFYPYPVAGKAIPDAKEYNADSRGMSIGDWRRDNVNKFIEQLHDSIRQTKPWVKFGVSPFGIYRNARSSSIGSNTRGLQNYDDLYADVLKWVNNGWIDYCVPQLYWQIGHKTADYETLIKWWNEHAGNRPLYIGEDVERTIKYADVDNPNTNQVAAKHKLHEQCKNVDGTVLWYAKAAVDNYDRYGIFLRNYYWKSPALQPLMPFIDDKAPKKPRKLKAHQNSTNLLLTWMAPKGNGWKDEAVKYVVYQFKPGESVDISDPSHIVSLTNHQSLETVKPAESGKYIYVVTALDRMSNESEIAKKKVKVKH
jgi:uncharacterized lipoprotein YddW (UPF0748 family)